MAESPIISRSTVLPPGTIMVFETTLDQWGNEVYTGEYILIGPSIDPATGGREILPAPIPPTYASPPVAKETAPLPGTLPGERVIPIHIVEGLQVRGGDYKLMSTGELIPRKVTGWDMPDFAADSDDQYASTNVQAGNYCAPLVLQDMDFSAIPENAIITGLRVTVERSKI
jgi:hypothetical protein